MNIFKLPSSIPRSVIIEAAVMAFIFTVAFVIRFIYVAQVNQIPVFAPAAGGLDDHFFHQMALDLLQGNWQGDATAFLQYRNSFYAYFLGLVYFIFGASHWVGYVSQAVVSSATCVLIYLAGKELFSKAAGIAGGLIFAFYTASIHCCGMLLGEPLCALTLMASLIFFVRFQKTRKIGLLFLGAALLGVSILMRINIIVLVPFLALWILFLFLKSSLRWTLAYLLVLGLGVGAALAPVSIRNYVMVKDLSPFPAHIGINFYMNYFPVMGGENPDEMIGSSIRIAEEKSGRKLLPSEVSRYWSNLGWEEIKRSGDILPFILSGTKQFVMFWNSHERGDIWSYSFSQQYFPILKFPFLSFSVIASFALAGLYLSWPRRRELSVLWVFLFGYSGSLVLSVALSRYRLPAVPFLSIFAGYFIAALWFFYRSERRKAFIALAIFAAVFLLTNLPIERSQETRDFAHEYYNIASRWSAEGKTDEAIRFYEKSISLVPNFVLAYENLGWQYMAKGLPDRAIPFFNQALAIDPTTPRARQGLIQIYNNEGNALAMAEKKEEAAAMYERALSIAPFPITYYNLGLLYQSMGSDERALGYFKRAAELDPAFELAKKKLKEFE